MMKQWFKKLQAVALAVAVVLGTSALLPGVPMTSNSADMYLSKIQSLHPQSTTSSVSLPANTDKSGNWGGYITKPASNQGYTRVSGTWTVPTISADQSNAVAAQWIGLGGVSTSDLLQIGTIETLEDGQPTAQIFWEKLPDTAQSVVNVPIGSTISASIALKDSSTNVWNLTYTVKASDGETQTQTIAVTLDSSYTQNIGTSAEWISEDPSNQNDQLYPLADMGTVNYSSAQVDGQPINASGNEVIPVAMVDKAGNVLIAPSALGSDGESFSTTVLATETESSPSSPKTHEHWPIQPMHGHMPHSRGFDTDQTGWGWSWTWTWSW